MRIIAGQHRGRRLKAPKGSGTRPTTDRVKESLMSAVSSRLGGFDGLTVLDAFAGSGALSLEALSRGATSAVACERDRSAVGALEENRRMLGCEDAMRIVKGDAFTASLFGAKPFDLVFLDPPYACPAADIAAFLNRLAEAGRLSETCLVTYEHATADGEKTDEAFASVPFVIDSRRTWGDTTIDFIVRDDGEGREGEEIR